ncbi:hypothetical protein Daus18300_011409 [Diaporthe australafricana]|uniref:Carboxylic ester hydrolase n=1 Tax=Diaporthe australafricana TaxID=127596 RepID=A0ABR3W6Q8_9PEZI
MKALVTLIQLVQCVLAISPGHYAWPRQRAGDALQVSTTSGRIQGKVDPSLPNVRQFLGIPYAKPPTGERRWTAPELLDDPDAQISAVELPPSCMQSLSTSSPSVYNRDVLEFNLQGLNRTGTISEDCLTASVWAPTNNQSGLPVLIYVYGGGFQTGGQDVPYQIPAQWVNRTQDHIVVSFNYRLNIFGFPNAAGLDDQNLALLDQRAFVQWCEKNMAAFGGDPSRMVLWGQSAGSISVDLYNFAYPDDPIVGGLIMDSGTAESGLTSADTPHSNFTFVAENVGCDGLGGDPAKELECMRGVDASKLRDFLASYAESGSSPSLSFNPVPDEKTVFSNYTERALQNLQAEIREQPAIIGTNTEDGVPFAPYNPNGPNQTIALQAALATFFCPSTQTTRLRQQTDRLTFRYLYAGNFTNISPRPWLGAYHSAELPMLMGTYGNFRGASSALEEATSRAFQDAYVAFASDPTNGLADQDWQVYAELGGSEVREFGAGVAVQDVSVADMETLCDGAQLAA